MDSTQNPAVTAAMPSREELIERRKPKFIMDVSDITSKEYSRIKAWGVSLMAKHEHKLNDKWKHLEIVTSGTVEPEAVDVRQVYPFPDLHWIIYRHRTCWVLLLMSKRSILSCQKFATI